MCYCEINITTNVIKAYDDPKMRKEDKNYWWISKIRPLILKNYSEVTFII